MKGRYSMIQRLISDKNGGITITPELIAFLSKHCYAALSKPHDCIYNFTTKAITDLTDKDRDDIISDIFTNTNATTMDIVFVVKTSIPDDMFKSGFALSSDKKYAFYHVIRAIVTAEVSEDKTRKIKYFENTLILDKNVSTSPITDFPCMFYRETDINTDKVIMSRIDNILDVYSSSRIIVLCSLDDLFNNATLAKPLAEMLKQYKSNIYTFDEYKIAVLTSTALTDDDKFMLLVDDSQGGKTNDRSDV
jgi:hypothetical protein